jgi:hypothetical protein
MVYTKTQKNNYYNKYFNAFIRYKLQLLKKTSERTLFKYFKTKNKFTVFRQNYIVRVRAKGGLSLTIRDFYEEITAKWLFNKRITDSLDNIQMLEPYIDRLPKEMLKTLRSFKETKFNSFSILNFLRAVVYLGFVFELNNIGDVKGVTLINADSFKQAIKDFSIVYGNRLAKDADRKKFDDFEVQHEDNKVFSSDDDDLTPNRSMNVSEY